MSKHKGAPPASDPPEVVELFSKIAFLLPKATGFDGVIIRSVGMKYANENDFFSGAGAAKAGGRWNRPGLPAIYGSLDVITATQEAYQNFVTFGFAITSIQPRVTAGAHVSIGKSLDLTAPKARLRIGFSLALLVSEDWRAIQAGGEESWTQAIGRGCYEAGFEGLIVPSAQNKNGKNIVIFPQRLANSSEIKVMAADQLSP